MAELRDKYSDAELDTSNKEFEEIVNRSDMRALDDQGDAIARDLQSAERVEIDKAESDGESPLGLYRPVKNTSSRFQDMSGTKKGLIAGLVGTILIGTISSIIMLIPLKVPGVLSMITKEAGQRLEQITEKRAKLILGRAILTKFGTHTGIVLTGDGAFKTLVASMRTNGFEKRLEQKGLKITQTNDGVKLSYKGTALGNGRTFKNEADIMSHLESNKLTNKMIKDIIKEDIPSWRWMKRAKFAKWLRIKYGVPRFGLSNSDKATEEERTKEIDLERAEAAQTRTLGNFKSLITCLMAGSCDKLKNSTDASKASRADVEGQSMADMEQAGEEAKSNIEKKGLANTNDSLVKIIVGKFGSKAIPIIGWIDLAATLDHIVYSIGAHDFLGETAAYFKAAQYGAIYAEWAGYASQIQLGEMNPEYVGVLANELNDAETAQAFQALQGLPLKGVQVETKVNSDKPSIVAREFENYINSPAGAQYKYVGHPVLNAYYETVGGGGFLGWAGGLIGGFISKILGPFMDVLQSAIGAITPESVKQAAQDTLATIGKKMMNMFGMSIDPLAKGPELMNNISGGAEVSFNEYCREIGCRKLSDEQAVQQEASIARERDEYVKNQGMLYALFNTEQQSSLRNQFIATMPTNFESSVGYIGSILSSLPAKIFSPFTKQLNAVSSSNIFGIQMYGATDSDLKRPLSQSFMEGGECPQQDGEGFNDCLIDKTVAEGMTCEFDPESEGCAENDEVNADQQGGSEFRISSFNIYYSSDESNRDYSIDQWEDRLKRSSEVIKSNGLQVVGLQEVRENQWSRILNADMLGSAYDIYPKNYASGGYASQNPIVWDTSKFELIEGKTIAGYQVLGPKNNSANIQVRLKDRETGQEFYVINHHEPVGKGDSIKARYDSANERYAYVKSLESNQDIPVFLTGDFNAGYVNNDRQPTYQNDRNNLSYCILTTDSLFWDAYDASNTRTGRCPTTDAAGVDHIYMSTEVNASGYNRSIQPRGNGSDVHNTLFVDVQIPGSGSGSGVIRAASFNIFHSTDPNWRDRLKLTVKTLTDNAIDVAGLQEVRPDQNKLFRDPNYGGGTYDMYPTALTNPDYSPNPIIWNKSKFKVMKTGSIPFTYFNGMQDKAPLVKLQDLSTGGIFYFINTHDPADARGPAAELRYRNALRYSSIFKNMIKEGLPIFFTGDFNSSYQVATSGNDTYEYKRENLTYCILTDGTGLWDAYDAFKGRDGICPSTNIDLSDGGKSNPVDHIFLSRDVNVTKFWRAPAGKQKNGSDVHDTVMAEASYGAGEQTSGWSWPIPKKWWTSDRADFLDAHTFDSGTWTSGIRRLASDISNPPDGTPVYAMLGGKVTRSDLGGHGLVISSEVQGGTLQIAYAHGPRTNKKTTYKSGEQIMKIGALGNVTGGHLHIDMAFTKNGIKKGVCAQDVFLALDAGKEPNLEELTKKAVAPCGR